MAPLLRSLFVVALLFVAQGTSVLYQGQDYVQITDSDGQADWVLDNRRPSLYTKDFGDCRGGGSALDITRFDAAYYHDNMTVLFHLEGNAKVDEERLMMYIGVYAYGQARFNLTFNPCNAQMYSMCPMNVSIPVDAYGAIPVSPSDVSGIPAIALSIPDFEGQAILRIFSNATKSEIGCYASVVTNGVTISHPKAVGTVVGLFVLVALGASFATSIYGSQLSVARTHHAHSISMLVVFAVLHHVYFTGALSMAWPSVLVAFWNNLAWSGGMIYSEAMQNSINHVIAGNQVNRSIAGPGTLRDSAINVGGGFHASTIYGSHSRRDTSQNLGIRAALAVLPSERMKFDRRQTVIAAGKPLKTSWNGSPVAPGLPLPGNFSSFPGTLSEQGIAVSNASMTAFLWLIALLGSLIILIVLFKASLALWRTRHGRNLDELSRFRRCCFVYLGEVLSRTLLIALFPLLTLVFFQLAASDTVVSRSSTVTGIAALVVILLVLGVAASIAFSFGSRFQPRNYRMIDDRLLLVAKRILGLIPWLCLCLESQQQEIQNSPRCYTAIRLKRPAFIPIIQTEPSNIDSNGNRRAFGFLTAPFRRSRWWFFAPWICYDIVRAGFTGAATRHPTVQVLGLLVVEIFALTALVILRPFESVRNNIFVTYILGITKIFTLALCASLNSRFSLPRIATAAIGFVIIVIQGLLIIALLVMIALGTITSYMSLARDREDFRPRRWTATREKFLSHVENSALDTTPQPPPIDEVRAPYFRVNSFARHPKIEDEYDTKSPSNSGSTLANPTTVERRDPSPLDGTSKRPVSTVPFGAKPYRTSWRMSEMGNTSFHSIRASRLHNCCDKQILCAPAVADRLTLRDANFEGQRGQMSRVGRF